jgi:ribA/ribD-fused uncharacterized protein
MKYNLDWLINETKTNKAIAYVLFWGHHRSKDGKIGISCLSQWFDIHFVIDNVRYLTAEHWMMSEKAKAFNDLELLPEILTAKTPEIVKTLGRRIKNFDGKIWDKHKYECVKKGNFHKFNQNSELKTYLISTGDKILVEASPFDKIWGIGLGKENPDSVNPEKWQGQNLLGFALMEVRDELKLKN